MSFKGLPTLYKKTSTGAMQMWSICTDDNVIVTRWGQLDGAVQETRDVISSGKNTGRANATTPEEQARKEAYSRWEKQLKNKKYVQTLELAQEDARDDRVQGGIDVMLAHRFDQQEHKITYPAYVQPKLDGHRMVAVFKDGKCTLWSRTRKQITGLPHIERAIEQLIGQGPGHDGMIFDGEAYNHAYKDRFEELSSFIRNETPKPGYEAVEYHIYDTPTRRIGLEFVERNADLRHFADCALEHNPPLPLKFVETRKVADEDELLLAFERYREQGYEGAMVRNARGHYVGKRSYDLQKLKEFQDEEFKVIGVTEGRGKMAGHAIFTCALPARLTFDAKMKGPLEKLKEYWENPGYAIGRKVTVQFQGWTKDKKPRFPVALRFREEE